MPAENSDASDRRIGHDDLKECWCCSGLHDSIGTLCPDCDDAGCSRFGGECESDHKPVLPDGGRTTHDWDGRRLPGRGAVVYDNRAPDRRPCCSEGGRCLHHVVGVYEEHDTGEVYVRVEDGTHTTAEWVHGDDFWELFDPAGWQFPVGYKPTYHLTRNVGVHDNHDLMLEANR